MNKRQRLNIRNKVADVFQRERITDLRRLFNAVRDEHFNGDVPQYLHTIVMSSCAYQIRNNK